MDKEEYVKTAQDMAGHAFSASAAPSLLSTAFHSSNQRTPEWSGLERTLRP